MKMKKEKVNFFPYNAQLENENNELYFVTFITAFKYMIFVIRIIGKEFVKISDSLLNIAMRSYSVECFFNYCFF